MGSILEALRRLETKSEPPAGLNAATAAAEPAAVPAAEAQPPTESPPQSAGSISARSGIATIPLESTDSASVVPVADDAESTTGTIPVSELWNRPAVDLPESSVAPLALVALEAVDQAISAELEPQMPDVELPAELRAPVPAEHLPPATPDPVQSYLPDFTEQRKAPVGAWTDLAPRRTSRHDLDELCGRIRAQLAPGIPPSLLFTSTDPAEGATGALVQLAEALTADRSVEVLTIDANLRRPDLSRMFEADRVAGLTEILRNGVTRNDLVLRTPLPGVRVLPAGFDRESVWDSAAEANFAALLLDLKRRFDLILIDAAAVSSTEVCGLSRCCDATYVVVRLGKTCRWDAIAAVRHLQTSGGRATGAILTNF